MKISFFKTIIALGTVIILMFSGQVFAYKFICGKAFENTTTYLDLDYETVIHLPGYTTNTAQQIRNEISLSGWEMQNYNDANRTGSRLLAALWVLKNAGDGNTPVLDQAYSYVRSKVVKIRADCDVSWNIGPDLLDIEVCDGSDVACYHGDNSNVHLEPQALYSMHVLTMAAMLYHEARHGDQGTVSALKGDDPHPGWPHGPYAYQVQWLAWFAAAADESIFGEHYQHLRRLAAYEANALAARRGFYVTGDIRSNTGNEKSVVYNHSVNRHSSYPLPRIMHTDCHLPNYFIRTATLSNIVAASNQVSSYCGVCNYWSEVPYYNNDPNQGLDYNNIELYCGIGVGGEYVYNSPYHEVTAPTPVPTPVPTMPSGSACTWSSQSSYSGGYGGGTYAEYPSIGSCVHSKKMVLTDWSGNETITYE